MHGRYTGVREFIGEEGREERIVYGAYCNKTGQSEHSISLKHQVPNISFSLLPRYSNDQYLPYRVVLGRLKRGLPVFVPYLLFFLTIFYFPRICSQILDTTDISFMLKLYYNQREGVSNLALSLSLSLSTIMTNSPRILYYGDDIAIIRDFQGTEIDISDSFRELNAKFLLINNCPNLESLKVNNCGLVGLSIGDCSNLSRLECYNNDILELDLGTVPSLQFAYVSHNKLDKLNVRDCSELTDLDCSIGLIEELNLKDCLYEITKEGKRSLLLASAMSR